MGLVNICALAAADQYDEPGSSVAATFSLMVRNWIYPHAFHHRGASSWTVGKPRHYDIWLRHARGSNKILRFVGCRHVYRTSYKLITHMLCNLNY